MAISIFPGYDSRDFVAGESITTEQVKARLRIDAADTSLDDQIPVLIRAARQYVERYTKCILYAWREITQYYDRWPTDDRTLKLSFFPLNPDNTTPGEILEYCDEGGVWQTLEGIDVDVVSFPHRIYIPESVPLPALAPGLSKIRATATYGSEDGPEVLEPLVQCMYMLIAAWLENPNDQDQSDLNYVHKILDQYTAR